MNDELVDQLEKMFKEANKALEKMAKELKVMSKDLKKKMEMPDLSGNAVIRDYNRKKERLRSAQVPWGDIVRGRGLASKPNENEND